MASGVYRPYTLSDVLGTLNQQSTATSSMITGLASFAQTAETAAVTDSVTAMAQANYVWDSGTWGTVIYS